MLHTYTLIYVHTYIHTYIHTYTHTHTHIHTYIHTLICTILLQYIQENEMELTEAEKLTRFKMTGTIVIAYLTAHLNLNFKHILL